MIIKKFFKYFISFFFIFCIIILYRYYQYKIIKNYILEVNTICNPEIEKCFDSEDLSFGQNPYKKVTLIASFAPKCLEEHNCEIFDCPSNIDSTKCNITYCSEETKVEEENCTSEYNN